MHHGERRHRNSFISRSLKTQADPANTEAGCGDGDAPGGTCSLTADTACPENGTAEQSWAPSPVRSRDYPTSAVRCSHPCPPSVRLAESRSWGPGHVFITARRHPGGITSARSTCRQRPRCTQHGTCGPAAAGRRAWLPAVNSRHASPTH